MAKGPTGMFGFSLVWLGQIISVLATNMSGFALTIFVFQKTGSATSLALMQVFFITPFLLISPIAGVWVDRYDRKTMMMVSDLTAGVATIAILVLQAFGRLEIWHLYAAGVFQGIGNAFQWPAYSAAISTMIPKEQYGRANGMMSLIEMGPGILAPMLAGAFMPLIQLTGILTIDVVTFILAILILLAVDIPQPKRNRGKVLRLKAIILQGGRRMGFSLYFLPGRTCWGLAASLSFFGNFLFRPPPIQGMAPMGLAAKK